MHTNKFEGMWEDLALNHADVFRGHRVEIRVLDPSLIEESSLAPKESWAVFEVKVASISKGKTIPNGIMYSAEDFYEVRK